MKELFREMDIIRVSYFKGLLEDYGIPSMIRNEYLTGSGLTEIAIPEFFPALCVLDDADYERAIWIIREHFSNKQKTIEGDIACASCGEINPGNFDSCWSCGSTLRVRNSAELISDDQGEETL